MPNTFTTFYGLPNGYVQNSTATPVLADGLNATSNIVESQIRGALRMQGMGVANGLLNEYLVTTGTGLSVVVASGGANVGTVPNPVAVYSSGPQTLSGIEANRGGGNPLYLHVGADDGTLSGNVSFQTGIPLFQISDYNALPGLVLLATITTGASSVLTVTANPDRFIKGGGDMTKAVYDTNNNGIVDNADKLSGQTLAQVRDRSTHTGTQTASTISDFNTAVRTNRLDQMANPTADVSLNGQKLTNVGAPTLSTDAARQMDVDAARAGLRIKDAVRAATTANIALSGTQTIDGVALVVGDRVLVKDQTTGSQNGLYVVAIGAWTRATDADTSVEVKGGMTTWVNEGTANGDKQFTLTTNDPITLGTTSLTFAVFSASGGVSSVNTQTGTVVLDGTNISDLDPTNSNAAATLRTIFSNIYTAVLARAPKGLLTASGLTISTGKLAGRSTAATGAIEEISIGTGLTMTAGTLTATASGGNTLPVSQTGHGFTPGNLVRSTGTVGQFTKAQADTDANSQVIGVVVSVQGTDNFTIGLSGALVTGLTGLSPGEGYYLSPTVAGFYTATKPTTAGQVQKFVLRAITTTNAIYEARTGILVVVGNPPTIVATSSSSAIDPATDVQEVSSASATTQTLPATYAGKFGRITIKQLGTGTITMAAASGTTLEAGTITTSGTSLDYYLSGTVWRKI